MIEGQKHAYAALYLDDGATNWTVRRNVCRKNACWWYLYKGSDNHASENWTDTPALRAMTTGPLPSTVKGTVLVKNDDWPEDARRIMKAAGPRAAK